MNIIELDGRPAPEVFEELKHRLEGMGFLPDEYFLLDSHWEDGRQIPEGADIFCTTDYGESEGIYLDAYLKWYTDGKPVTQCFVTGKTLGESGSDMDRMFLISSAITKAFHGDHGTYARYVKLGDPTPSDNMILHLNPAEQRTLLDALIQHREALVENTMGTEQLLRRMTGSITAYMSEVGQRPLRISDYDKTVLAIQDGDFWAFKDLYPKALEQANDLLVEVSGRPGIIGGNMLLMFLSGKERFSQEAYLTACKLAVDTGDLSRVQTLLEQAPLHVPELAPSFYGQVMQYAYQEHTHMVKPLIQNATPEQIAATPPRLLSDMAIRNDYKNTLALVEKGINAAPVAVDVLRAFTNKYGDWMAELLLENGMEVDLEDYRAFHICVQKENWKSAELLLDRGMDFEQYRMWAEERGELITSEKVDELQEYWVNLHTEPEQGDTPSMEGMSL